MLIEKIQYISEFLNENLPKEEYLIVNSAWLSLMNIRINGDLDILISTKIWDKKFKKYNKQINFGLTKNFDKWIRVHSIINGPYVRFLKLSNDDLIYNYRCEINGIPFIFQDYILDIN